MKKELIEIAADVYGLIERPLNGEFVSNAIAEACERGAKWRINSVWHDARKDVPEKFISILVERDDFTFSVNMVCGNMTSCPLHWVHWAYVIDLLPERKEEYNESR